MPDNPTPEEISAAMSVLGRIKTAKKAKASNENIEAYRGNRKGVTLSPETRAKMSEAQQKRRAKNTLENSSDTS